MSDQSDSPRYALAVLKDRRWVLNSGPPARSFKPGTLKTVSAAGVVPAVLEHSGSGRVVEVYELLDADETTTTLKALDRDTIDRIALEVARKVAPGGFGVPGLVSSWLSAEAATRLAAQNDSLRAELFKERKATRNTVETELGLSVADVPTDQLTQDRLQQRIELLEDQLASVTEDRELSEERARVANSQLEMVLNASTQALTELLLASDALRGALNPKEAAGFRLAGAKNLLRGLDVTGVSKKVPALAAAWAEATAGTDPVTGQPIDEEGA